MPRLLTLLIVTLLLSSCANIVKNSRQHVFFKGGPENGVTRIISPDGTFEVENGSGSFLMTRSKPDIPLKIKCPNGTIKHGQAQTSFDWLAGGLGNWWTYFIGSIFDAVTDKGYDIKDVSLSSYCNS